MAFLFSCDLCCAVLVTLLTLVVLWVILKSFVPKPRVLDYHNKYVLITGCDTGFGRTTAIRLDELGFRVIAACLTKEGKENIRDACSARLVGVLMDVTNSKQIQDVYEELKRSILPDNTGLWAVVNNAGYMTLGPLEWFKIEEYKRMADVNLWGLIDVTKTFLPLVKKAKGRVVNFSSIAGLFSAIGMAPYSVTKYGVEAFSDVLRREMVRWGVKVSILEPQAFKTPLWNEIADNKITSLWNGISDEMRKEYGVEYFTQYKNKLLETINHSSENSGLVVNAIIDAVTSRDPPPRYLVGGMAKYFGIFALLPTGFQDFLLKRRVNEYLSK